MYCLDLGSLGTDLSRGQVGTLMLAALALGLYLLARGRELGAGFWMALPPVIKLFPPFLLLYPVWRGRWRMVAGAWRGRVRKGCE